MKKRSSKFNWFRVVALSVCVILFITIVYSGKNIISLYKEQKELEEQNSELTDERDNLKLELENVNTDDFIEEQARRQLKLINPDEILFVLPEEKEETEDDKN